MTIKEIAALAGVSPSTVSKIMNGKDQNINPSTRSRVLQIAKEHHYEPYSTVKNIVTQKKFLIGLLLNSLINVSEFVAGILSAAQECGYQVFIFSSNGSAEQELKHITALCNSRVDGVIWEPVGTGSIHYAHLFSRQDIPAHCINAPDGFPSYDIDFEKAGYTLTQKLIENSHTAIACLLRENDSRSDNFQKGFQRCLYEHKITMQKRQILSHPTEDICSTIAAHNITGVISAYRSDAVALYEHMERLHYHIPSTISLTALDDATEGQQDFPHISCIRVPYRDFGYDICKSLIQTCEKCTENNLPFLFAPEYTFNHQETISVPSFLRLKKLVVVGSIHMDVTFIVDRLPQAGKTTEIHTSVVSVGGKGANQSVGAAKLGREVCLIGKLGSDLDSTIILSTLEKEHIMTHGISRDMNAPTGKAYIYTESDGESTITILSGANHALNPSDIKQQSQLFDNAGFCLLSTEIPLNTIIEAAHTARAAGAKVILKPAVLKELPDELFSLTDIFIPNQKEASLLCPHKSAPQEQAEYFFQKGIPTVIITLGDKGCYFKDADNTCFFPAADFAPVDTTGGADAFISALASYLTEGYCIKKAIQIAAYAAGFCVSRQGVVSALADRNILESYIAQNAPQLLIRN